MKTVYTGLESSGKSLALAKKVISLIKRNKKWEKKYGFRRLVRSNLIFSEKFAEKYKDYIVYWKDMKEIIKETGCDIIWDEISSDFSALKKEPLPRETNRWLRQGAKQGVHIYATAQEFHDIHLDFRRRVKVCHSLKKILGSPRGGKNLPKVKRIWGLCLSWELKIHPYNELEPQKQSIIPELLFITRELCEVFNTHQVIENSEERPFEHIERKCEKYGKGCNYKKIIHR